MSWEKGFNSMWLQRATKGENVYFISDGEFVKIGKTTGSPECRLASLQTGNPRELTIVGIAFLGTEKGTVLEYWLHGLLKKYRVRGEWFSLDALSYLVVYLNKNGKRYGENQFALKERICDSRYVPQFLFNDKLWKLKMKGVVA